ncbi:MAG TPA: hypothetical protein VGE11_20020 [Pseudonocardia sp.]
MDQDNGRGPRGSTPRRDGHAARPKHRLEEPPPPAGLADPAPLPLPRRAAQAHIEPQLRHPGSSGTGTPFNPFAPHDDAVDGKAGDTGKGSGKTGEGKTGEGKTGEGKTGNGTTGAPAPRPRAEPKAKTAGTSAAAFKKGTRQGRRRPPAG